MWFGPHHSPTHCVHVFLVEIQGSAYSHSNYGTSVSDECVRISQITMLCFCRCSVGKFPVAMREEVIAEYKKEQEAVASALDDKG